MKKWCIAAALACTTGAWAQSNVTLSGIADAYAGSIRMAGDGRRTVLNSGGMSTSYFGFSGVEDLGGGLKAGFVLGNLRNHVDGMGGPEGVKLAVVVHGPALRAFRADSGNEDFKARFGRLVQEGVAFHACRHTMDGMKLGLSDLLPGFAVAEKGGVVLLAELQSEGWLYLRP